MDPSRVTRADGRDNGQNDGMSLETRGLELLAMTVIMEPLSSVWPRNQSDGNFWGDIFGGSRLMAKGDEQVRELVSQLLTSVRSAVRRNWRAF